MSSKRAASFWLAYMQWPCLTIGLHPPPWSSRAPLYRLLPHTVVFVPPSPFSREKRSAHPHLSLCIFWTSILKGRLWLMEPHWSSLSVCMYVWVRLRAHTPSCVHAYRLCFTHKQEAVRLRRLHQSCSPGIKVHSRGKWWWSSQSIKTCATNSTSSSTETLGHWEQAWSRIIHLWLIQSSRCYWVYLQCIKYPKPKMSQFINLNIRSLKQSWIWIYVH